MDESSKAALMAGAEVIRMRIAGLSKLLASRGHLHPEVRAFLAVITDQADDMIHIVRDEISGEA